MSSQFLSNLYNYKIYCVNENFLSTIDAQHGHDGFCSSDLDMVFIFIFIASLLGDYLETVTSLDITICMSCVLTYIYIYLQVLNFHKLEVDITLTNVAGQLFLSEIVLWGDDLRCILKVLKKCSCQILYFLGPDLVEGNEFFLLSAL